MQTQQIFIPHVKIIEVFIFMISGNLICLVTSATFFDLGKNQ